jgi:hypothetical protein
LGRSGQSAGLWVLEGLLKPHNPKKLENEACNTVRVVAEKVFIQLLMAKRDQTLLVSETGAQYANSIPSILGLSFIISQRSNREGLSVKLKLHSSTELCHY